MARGVSWHGSGEEWTRLWLAIGCHCTCEFDEMMGVERAICAAHMMLTDQLVLDHLLHVRRLRQWFNANEWSRTWPSELAVVAR